MFECVCVGGGEWGGAIGNVENLRGHSGDSDGLQWGILENPTCCLTRIKNRK